MVSVVRGAREGIVGGGGGVREGTWEGLMLALRRDRGSERCSGLTRQGGKGPRPGELAHLRNAGDWGGLDVKAGQVGLPSDHGGFHRSD